MEALRNQAGPIEIRLFRLTISYRSIVTFLSLLLLTCLGMQNAFAAASDDFVTTWKTDNPGTSNDTSIIVPMVGGPYDVDWDNDGTFDEFGLNGFSNHNYGHTGTKTIRIRGTYDSIRFQSISDRQKIVSIDQWGTNAWQSMAYAFAAAVNLQVPATDTPDFSAVTDFAGMFGNAASANPYTRYWDTSAVTNMTAMFSGATLANPDTSLWDTSKVTDMSWIFSATNSANPNTSGWDTSRVTNMTAMFQTATSANPDTSGWDTSAVTDMSSMFRAALSADPDTSGWDTSAVTDMSSMFRDALSANPDTSGWDTSAVTDMGSMFRDYPGNPDTSLWNTAAVTNFTDMFMGATSANPDTSGWDTGAVTYMGRMFSGATSFDRDIRLWNVTALSSATGMLTGVTLSSANYESLLIGWNTQAVKSGVGFSAGNSTFCSPPAVAARDNLIESHLWRITDGGQQCPQVNIAPVVGLETSEAGGTATFDVFLSIQPTANVNFGLASSNPNEGTVQPTSLTFTSLNWATPQTVTITGVDDALDDDDQAYSIITSNTVSADVHYNNLDPVDVLVTNMDNENAQNYALIALYNNTNGPGWRTKTNWLAGDPCANNWYGITCDSSSNITHITLKNNRLTGTLPVELGNLPKLLYVNLNGNQLSGAIPAQLGNLDKLRWLFLHKNELNGSIPAELGSLTSLQTLHLFDNQLYGTIPDELGNLSSLTSLLLHENLLNGEIPGGLGNLNLLTELNLFSNQLSGAIPASLGNLLKLTLLDLSANQLSGRIPATLGNLNKLTGLYLDKNRLFGAVPASLANLSSMSTTPPFGYESSLNVHWNALYTENTSLDNFLNTMSEGDWSETQTTAPEMVTVSGASVGSVVLDWDPVEFPANRPGRYHILHGTTEGGPYANDEVTTSKNQTSYAVSGLTSGVHYFVVQTETDSHYYNSNAVLSEYSEEVSFEVTGAAGVSINSFQPTPSLVEAGESIMVTWSTSNATECFAVDGVDGWAAEAIELPNGNASLMQYTPGTHTYTLECTDGINFVSEIKQVTVLLPEDVVEINSFTISPTSLDVGQSAVISWDVSNADSCVAVNGTGNWPGTVISTPTGQMNVVIEAPGCHTFGIECTDGLQTVSASEGVYAIDTDIIFVSSFGDSSACGN